MEWNTEGRNDSDDASRLLKATCDHYDIDMECAVEEAERRAARDRAVRQRRREDPGEVSESASAISASIRTPFEGIINNLRRRYLETTSDYIRSKIEGYMAQVPCPACHGKRLKPAALAVTVGGRGIHEMTHRCR